MKLLAFDLDGTLTQHKSPLSSGTKEILDKLGKKYKLLMLGAGDAKRIYNQMGKYPIDIIGNYGMQYMRYNNKNQDLETVYDVTLPCNRDSVQDRIYKLRETFGYTSYKGENVEYHISGCVTIPLLGTKAELTEKLSFDPDRKKRRYMYRAVKEAFPEYNVFVGGSSSFDMAPLPYDKYYALSNYAKDRGLSHDSIVFIGDDYGEGGNDESVYKSDYNFICIDDYRDFPDKIKHLSLAGETREI
ncbi:MAG: HAD hydrolase family protein [Bacillota bacterium]|nr:HAD hydrolase family protein [Bacillota bacterium]